VAAADDAAGAFEEALSVDAGAAGFAPNPPNENPPDEGAAAVDVEAAAFPVAGGVKEGVDVVEAGAVVVVVAGFPNEKVGAGGLAAGVVELLAEEAPNAPNGLGLSAVVLEVLVAAGALAALPNENPPLAGAAAGAPNAGAALLLLLEAAGF
jgi:hypothetical protein